MIKTVLIIKKSDIVKIFKKKEFFHLLNCTKEKIQHTPNKNGNIPNLSVYAQDQIVDYISF